VRDACGGKAIENRVSQSSCRIQKSEEPIAVYWRPGLGQVRISNKPDVLQWIVKFVFFI
jgi:hypothetical protein